VFLTRQFYVAKMAICGHVCTIGRPQDTAGFTLAVVRLLSMDHAAVRAFFQPEAWGMAVPQLDRQVASLLSRAHQPFTSQNAWTGFRRAISAKSRVWGFGFRSVRGISANGEVRYSDRARWLGVATCLSS
jgi:hypothetical protein